MPESAHPPPSADDRRQAACMAMGSAPGLIRFAARYTRSLHDAEDAYQRAMEIALTRAPVTEQRRFMAWLHTVLRNEALAVAKIRRREGPGLEADVPGAYENSLEEAVGVGDDAAPPQLVVPVAVAEQEQVARGQAGAQVPHVVQGPQVGDMVPVLRGGGQ